MLEKNRKKIFWLILGVAFVMIYAYNLLTPYLSDDYFYRIDALKARSLWDLIKQQYGEYLSNSGRIVGQFNVRLSLISDKQIFNFVNSGMFIALVGLIYANVYRRKKHDIFLLLLIICFLWRYTVDFGQTMLWICGACNYLWGSVIILGFITFFRYYLDHVDKIKHIVPLTIGTFFFALWAGWCNENTSGGGLLLVLLFGFIFFKNRRAQGKRALYPFMITAVLGMLCGLMGMVLAPGVRTRSAVMADGEYVGLIGLISRIYKVTMTMQRLFLPVLMMLIIVLVLLILQKKLTSLKQALCYETILFFIAFVATAYALAIPPTPMNRAFFGAGIFLFIALFQGITDVKTEEFTVKAVKYSLVSVLCLWLFFTYTDNLVNLARIYREEQERIGLILQDKNDINGDGIVVVPQFREAFRNPYSDAHNSDMTEDKEYWINHFYEIYYDIGNITAIPRAEWEEQYGGNSVD